MVQQISVHFPGGIPVTVYPVETDQTPDSVEIGQNAKRETYIKSVKAYFATDATPEEIAERVKDIFDAVDERIHPEVRAARLLRGEATEAPVGKR